VVIPRPGHSGRFFCSCGGTQFDTAGRVRKGISPENLVVPEARIEGRDIVILSPHRAVRDHMLRETLGWD
jgi:Rieske Fe-S protein